MENLNEITTVWSLLEKAHAGRPPESVDAKRTLIERYDDAVRRYLLCITHDPHVADELTQEFAIRLVDGKLKNADPQRGRFRDYVKTILTRLVMNHHKQSKKNTPGLSLDSLNQIPITTAGLDKKFDPFWRDALLEGAWKALAEIQPRMYAVLRFRECHGNEPSWKIAEYFNGQYKERITAAGIRQTLHRARLLFCELLVMKIAGSLQSPTVEEIEQELADLQLLEFCGPVLDSMFAGAEKTCNSRFRQDRP